MSDYLDALLAQVNRFSEQNPDDLDAWIDDVLQGFQLAQACAQCRTWLKNAQGANAEQLRGEFARAHEEVIRCLNMLGQRAFMLWGVRIPRMSLSKDK